MENLVITPGRKRRGKKTAAGLSIVAFLYAAAVFADFLSPYDHSAQSRSSPSAPPAAVRFRDAEGNFRMRPFLYPMKMKNPLTRTYEEDRSAAVELEFFVEGYEYKLFGLFSADTHLFAGSGERPAHLLGTDELGRDRLSRLLHAARFSLFVSPAGTLLACLIGIGVGIISGYAGKFADTVLMGAADTVIALPTLILILAARAAFPLELPPATAAVLLISIFAATGWADMARLARGLVVSAREAEYVTAAKALGLNTPRILVRHILPNISRPLVTQATLMLPAFLLAEVALSFLGVGLQEPEPSLGNMLSAAGNSALLAAQPMAVLSPAIVIFAFVLGVRLVSDGLRQRQERI